MFKGVLVHHVPENSPAYKAGLRNRDLITEVNCSSVIDAEHALLAAQVWKDGRILLQVWNGKGLRHLVIYKS
jgi:S1-C subfamily serine protease